MPARRRLVGQRNQHEDGKQSVDREDERLAVRAVKVVKADVVNDERQ
jgi:hypothetical protein